MVAVASAALGLLLIGMMLAYARYGYDFTDEGFYLVRISDPFANAPAVSQFGIVYYPFYRLLNGGIAELRQFNLSITFLSGACLCFVALHQQKRRFSTPALLLVSVAVASMTLLINASFLLTPNYSSLALQGLILTAIGLILAQHEAHPWSVAGWLLTAFGGWLVFLAKLPSAALLAVFALIYLAAMRKLRLALLLLAVGFAILLLLGTALVLDGSIMGFVERLQRGAARLASLEGRTISQILRWDSFTPDRIGKLLIFGLAIWTFAVLCLSSADNTLARSAGQMVAVVAGIAGALILFGYIAIPVQLKPTPRVLVYGPFWGLLAFLMLGFVRRDSKRNASPPGYPQWPLIFLLVLLPFVYSVGTNNNYWNTFPDAALFWGIAGCILLFPRQDRVRGAALLPAWAIILQLPVSIALTTGMQWPYRQPQPVRSFDGSTEVGADEARLVMSRDFATYLDEIRAIMTAHGFAQGDSIIDLSGQSPGVLFALGANNIGQPWMIGGYPGSAAFARKVLTSENCEALGSSWILVEPDGPRSISTDILESAGLPFPGSYEIAGEVMTPVGGGGFARPRQQIIYKPSGSLANIVSICRANRH
ncbi:MAG: hypothetical protein WBA42_15150 [Mesorhizobium sp.]